MTDTRPIFDLPQVLRANAASLWEVAARIERGEVDDDTAMKLYLALVSAGHCYNELMAERATVSAPDDSGAQR